MPRPKQVKMTGPDGQEGLVVESAVAAWERHGWTRADDGSSKKGSTASAEKTTAAKKTTRKAE